jgi:hypothetical protein
MKSISIYRKLIKYLSVLFLYFGLAGIIGCDDSGVVPEVPAPVYHYVFIYKNVTMTYLFTAPNDSSNMGVNLLLGVTTKPGDSSKDMELTGTSSNSNFYLRSGDLSPYALGFKTLFNRPYADMSSSDFDTVTVIPNSDSLLTPADFTQDYTSYWGYFNIGQLTKPVFSFYLAGKYNLNQSGSLRVFGVFHVKEVQNYYSSIYHSYGVKMTIDIKVNRGGKNSFIPD